MKKLDPAIYRPGSLIGKAGVERYYDRELRGVEGTEYVEVTAAGQLLGATEDQPQISPIPGNDLILTIDNDIQKAASESFGEFCCGAAVVLDPRNGEILAMVSKPPNDANVFSSVMTTEIWQAILADSTNPLLNRPVDGLYPPGSTFKLMVAGAALELGLIDRTTMFTNCNGGYRFGNRIFHCWEKGGHGRLPVLNAIEQSCDVFFYQVGLRLGLEEYAKFARACGFGQRTLIDLPQEAAGLVPSTQWYNKRLGKGQWTQAVLLNLAIGQGELLVTPLQLAQFYSGLANGGRVFKPHLLRSIIGPDGRETFRGGEFAFDLPFSKPTIDMLREGLYNVIQGGRGTARGARIAGTTLGGKTGTAQNPHGQDHSWFVGYAPADNPEILACVIVENAGHGSTYAAPAVRGIIKTYLTKHHLPGGDTTVVAGMVP
jgi:penicillin-binding protein 2